MTKVTIEDISRYTGLSRGTVSRALNDRPDISQQTKQRVLEACQQLRYVPSHAARSLATGRRYAVAVLFDDLRCSYASSFLRGVIGRARSERYAVHVSDLSQEPEEALVHLQTLVNERVDALLVAAAPPELQDRLAEVVGDRPAVSAVPIRGVDCDMLGPDYSEAGRLVARHLLEKHADGVLYVHETGCDGASRRLAGFREACAAAGLNAQDIVIEVQPPLAASGDRLAAVQARLDRVRGIAASHDYLAVELMLLCARRGRQPGQDVAIMGQGNELVGGRMSPGLTTIDFCGEEIGRRALDVALQRVSGARQDAPEHTLVPPVLVERETTRLG
jgi:DNA-binding LacI/PurR family transcriptional regulator